jgi:hypothetical protein
VKAVHFSSP